MSLSNNNKVLRINKIWTTMNKIKMKNHSL